MIKKTFIKFVVVIVIIRAWILMTKKNIQIKLLIENKLIICALGNLHYEISREKFEPEPGFNIMADRVINTPPGKSGISLKREI